MILPVKPVVARDKFDFADLYLAQTMMIRLNKVALVVVLNDAGGAFSFFQRTAAKITGPLSGLQLREVMVEMAFLNLLLKRRPVFRSTMDKFAEVHRIHVTLPPRPELRKKIDMRLRGSLMHHAFKEAIATLKWRGHSSSEVEAEIKAGRFTVLLNEKGEFNKASMIVEQIKAAPKKRRKLSRP